MNLQFAFIETLERRELLAFTYWSSIGPAIALVPQSAGQLASVSVVNFGTTVYTGPLNVTNTLNRIRADNGPDRSDDGIVYTSPQASGLPVDGTYYEFTVEPSSGTDRNFTTISSPGPMRILLATGGDCYFTGDHYSTFTAVYIPGTTTATPTIGSFAASPASVTAGTATTLTASNVTETGGTISGVKFYLESNGTTGLQPASDTLVGSGTQSGTTWTLSAPTTGLAAGTYTYYAVANDSNSGASNASSTTLTVTSGTAGTPVIGSFIANPASVAVGASTTLTASGVTETGGTISNVKFYRETNGTTGLQITGDTLIGTGTQNSSTWTINTSTTGFTAGTYTYYAVATDTNSLSSATSTATLGVTSGAATGVLAAWDVNGQSNFGTQGLAASQVSTGVTNSLGLTRGSGVITTGSAGANAWGGTNWSNTSAVAITQSSFVTFGLTVAANETASLSTIDLYAKRSGTGPPNGYWQYQLNAGSWVLIGDYAAEFSTAGLIPEINLSGISALQNLAAGTSVNFRVVPYGTTNTGSTWYVGDQTGNDLIIGGTASAVVTAAPLNLAGPADYLKLDSDGLHVDIWNSTTDTGAISQSILLSQITTMAVTGSAADDSLTLDFSAGDPLVAGGISFDGGTAGQNTLNLIGTSGNDVVSVGASSLIFGSVPIAYAHTSTISFTGGTGSDVLTQTAQPGAALVFNSSSSTDSLNVSAGTFSFPSAPTNAGATVLLQNLSIGTGAKVMVPAPGANANPSVLVLTSLTVAGSSGHWTGQLDLSGNDMIVQGGSLATIVNQLSTGITSSAAMADTTLLHALGVALNNDGTGAPLYSSSAPLGTFDGQSPPAASVLVRYTIYGDANLDGTVDGSDYSRIDYAYLHTLTGWFNGDFNYDNTINGSDYTLIDNAFNTQGASATAQIATPTAAAAALLNRPVTSAGVTSVLYASEDDELTRHRKFATSTRRVNLPVDTL